jgi:hypothetical protein
MPLARQVAGDPLPRQVQPVLAVEDVGAAGAAGRDGAAVGARGGRGPEGVTERHAGPGRGGARGRGGSGLGRRMSRTNDTILGDARTVVIERVAEETRDQPAAPPDRSGQRAACGP